MLKGYKTVIFNALAGIIPILELTEVRDIIPAQYVPYYALGVVLANMALRYVTTTPVGRK